MQQPTASSLGLIHPRWKRRANNGGKRSAKGGEASSSLAGRGVVDTGPEDWPNGEHMAQSFPAGYPVTEEATYDLIAELRDMEVVIPNNPFQKEEEQEAAAAAAAAAAITSPDKPSVDDYPISPTSTIGRSTMMMSPGDVDVDEDEGGEREGGVAAGSSLFPKGRRICGSPFRVLRVRLPTAEELPIYPQALSDHLQHVALDTLRVMMYPRILLRLRMRARAKLNQVSDQSPKLTAQLVSTVALFKSWPPEAIAQVIKEAEYTCYDSREYIAFEGEPPKALYFIVSGTCRLLTRANKGDGTGSTAFRVHGRSSRNKRINSGNVHPPQLAVSPTCFGAVNLLTNEPFSQTLRTVNKVEVYVLSRAAFNRSLVQVPAQVSSFTITAAFERRNEKMRSRFPVTVETLKLNNLFSRVSNEFAQLIISKMEPCAVPEHFTLLSGGCICEAMYFVLSGVVGFFRSDDASVAGSIRVDSLLGSEDKPLRTESAPILVGDSALMYSSANEHTVTSLSDCDTYMLTKAAFSALCRQHPSEVDTMLDAARDQRKAELKDNHLKFRALLQSMPIFREVIPAYFEREFLNLFTPKSYRPMSCVCSVSSFCDRIMVLTKGKLKLGDGDKSYILKRWESIGWTCCVPHRWGDSAMALEKTVETLELSYLDLMLFLHDRQLLTRVTHMIKVLMFPRAYKSETVEEVKRFVGPHFLMYPVSRSIHVNFYEMGFCTVHMSALEESEKTERERQAIAKTTQVPVYRQLSKGVWVPRRTN